MFRFGCSSPQFYARPPPGTSRDSATDTRLQASLRGPLPPQINDRGQAQPPETGVDDRKNVGRPPKL